MTPPLSDAPAAADQRVDWEHHLQVALDNMPGALVYTNDDLKTGDGAVVSSTAFITE